MVVTDTKRKQEATEKAIKDGGFYGKNGVWNSIITFPPDKTLYRHRVETIVVKNNKSVFVKKKFDGSYYLPGGSTEKDTSNIEQARNECQEEAHISIKNIEATGITYKEKHDPPKWAKRECDVEWNGTYTEVYVAEYDGKFNGKVNKEDEDPFIRSGEWYPTKECFKFFKKEHREALLWFIKNHQESSINEETITESYVSNYFKNKRLLKKISHHPDIERSAVEQMISVLKKSYSELSTKSKIQREKKRDDVESIFHPILTFDFPDKSTITIALCFDESSFTDGAAIHTDDYGDIVIIYPSFFKENKEQQIFTILHEIGHVRLNHLYTFNSPSRLLAKNNDEYRFKTMDKGKAMYPEVNADLYAVLNGASMYTILGSTFKKDTDNEYDYRFTNAELASRYSGVFNQYKKLRKFQESSDDGEIMNFSVTRYDIACSVLHDLVYANENTDDFSNNEKDILYDIMYELAINNNIKNESYVIKAEKEFLNASLVLESKESIYKKYQNICESDISNISNEDLEFKLKVESCNTGSDITVLENDLYNLRNRYNMSVEGVMYARCKAYDSYALTLEKASCIISPSKPKNEKAVILSSEVVTVENNILNIADKVVNDYYMMDESSLSSKKLSKYIYLIESLTTKDRNKIPLEKFGIPEKRAYPLDTKKHVKSAIALFGHCDKKYRKDLASNIFVAMDKYDIPKETIGENSPLRDYL